MLQASNISKTYGDMVILDQVSFVINAGERLGLIGPNGCGKTTLLHILAGRVQADSGSVMVEPPDLRIGYLEQGLVFQDDATVDAILRAESHTLLELEAEVEHLAAALADASGPAQAALLDRYAETLARLEHLAAHQTPEHVARSVLEGLGLDQVPLDTPVRTLSGGQKTRLALARLLVQDPHVLLLDEPTNHLDLDALEWLEQWLRAYEGAVLIVSHDRTFLDRTVTTVLDLDMRTHRITVYPGDYSAYLSAKQREIEKQWDAYTQQQERFAQLRGEVRRLSGYARGIELTTIDFGPRKIAKGIARRATVQKRRLERELSEDAIEKPRLSWHMKLEFGETPPSGHDVLMLRDLDIGYDGKPLVRGINETVQQGERIALIGFNGAGKTTLLRVLNGSLAPLRGTVRQGANVRIGYYAQEQENLDPSETPFSTVRAVAEMSDTDVRSFLHYFLFAGDEAFTPNRHLSYGERARLVLARLVAQGCNCLLLDEPINHLDIPSRSSFEQAMTAFEGTVVAVVHDRYFIEGFATRIWAIEAQGLRSYVDLEDYQRIRRAKRAEASSAVA